MKIRNDFVTNSSSSSFVLEIKVKDINGNTYELSRDPSSAECDGTGDASFFKDITKAKKCKTIEQLADFLIDGIYDSFLEYYDADNYDMDDDFDEEEYESNFASLYIDMVKSENERFKSNLIEKIKDVKNIQSVELRREYYANGEFADLIADNDEELCQYAKQYLKATDEEKEKIKKEMIDYINTPNSSRGKFSSFGNDFADFRYCFNNPEDRIDELANRLCSNYGPGDVSGTEYIKINFDNGQIEKYAVFYLS